eukprot:860866-Alexandrium_andersonii.AAC.1
MEAGTKPTDWASYLVAAARPARWADGLLLHGVADLLGRKIVVLEGSDKKWKAHPAVVPPTSDRAREAQKHPALIIALRSGHFMAVECAEGHLPQD